MPARDFRILVASDGSLAATAALMTATSWPWPSRVKAFGIVAQPLPRDGRAGFRGAGARAAEEIRTGTERILERRWPDVRVWRYAGDPTAMIVRQAQRTRSDLIVMGWRGHGVVRRLLVGSVSRGVVRHAPCSVLVVRRASRSLRRIVLGYDGSPNAGRAIDFVARLTPVDARITVVMAVPLMPAPSRALTTTAVKGTIADEVRRTNARRLRAARRALRIATTPLRAAGINVRMVVTEKAPLDALLDASASAKADLVVVGATGATRLRGLLLGSVAQGSLDRSRVPVLVVR
jgi:nucleotide-binding universal stress UspA family protein